MYICNSTEKKPYKLLNHIRNERYLMLTESLIGNKKYLRSNEATQITQIIYFNKFITKVKYISIANNREEEI